VINRTEITTYLDTFFTLSEIHDVSWNGLQFEGTAQVQRIAFAVDAGIATFEAAAKAGADMLIVHHGLFWGKANPVITGVHRKRLGILFDNNLSLYAVHLPLDAHAELGNNSGIIALLGALPAGRFCDCGKINLGAFGMFDSPKTIEEISSIFGQKLGVKPFILSVSDRLISKIAVMSGACGRDDLIEAAKSGADLMITGEQSEFFHDAHDYGISVLFVGHHASETVGVSLLQKHLAKQFPQLETIWIDCPTGL